MGYSSSVTLISGGNILPSRFVKLSTAADFTGLQATTTNEAIIGISMTGTDFPPGVSSATQYAAQSGEQLMIFTNTEVCLLSAGSTFNAGTYLTSNSTGQGVPASAGNHIGAVALEASAASGNLVRVQVQLGTY